MKNPWPILLPLVIAAFVVMVVGSVIWSFGHRVELVAPDYYEREIRHQEQIERVERTRKLPAHGLIHDPAAGTLTVRIPVDHVGAKGHIELYRPSNAKLDQEMALAVDAQGFQEIDLSALEPGLWRARLNWTAGTNEYYADLALIAD